MSIEIIGMVGDGTQVDAGYLARFAQAHAAERAAIAKLTGTRAAIKVVERAVALVGNNGLTRKYPLDRHYRDVLCARVHTPQDDSVVAAAGRSALAAAGLADLMST